MVLTGSSIFFGVVVFCWGGRDLFESFFCLVLSFLLPLQLSFFSFWMFLDCISLLSFFGGLDELN